MEGRRRQKWDKNKRSQNRRPARGTCSWQPTVPSWEKEFCRVVGSLDWETLLQMKKFTHLYENVIKWNDSAGEDAFSNAKKRFWAEINGLPCDTSLPDPDLYIDKVDWDSKVAPELLSELESKYMMTSNEHEQDHDPVVIFGDSLLPNQAYSPTGWGDDEDNLKFPPNSSPVYHGGDPLEQNWGDSFDNGAPIGWPGYSDNNEWCCVDGGGYTASGAGWNNESGWNYANNSAIDEVGPNIEQKLADGEYRTSRIQENDPYRRNTSRNGDGRHKGRREWNSFNSCGPISHRAAITVGQTWNH